MEKQRRRKRSTEPSDIHSHSTKIDTRYGGYWEEDDDEKEELLIPTAKNKTTAIILSLLLGGLGIDRFYLGYGGLGLLKLLSMGGFGIWWIIDLVMICSGSLLPAGGLEYDEVKETGKIERTTAMTSSDAISAIERLYELYERGIISEDEYWDKRGELMERI